MTRSDIMTSRSKNDRLLLCVALSATLLAGPATAADTRRAVVELFTSQGCSSCPPANENLSAISHRPDVVALSFGVTYWDRLGWKDTFARKDFTARQAAYEAPLGEAGPFTPQIVVGGRASIVGDELAAIDTLVARDLARAPAASIELTKGRVAIGAGQAPSGGADIWLVRYDPARIAVSVHRGENGGRTLTHTNVVRDLSLLGRWSGTPQAWPVPPAADGLRTAVLVQARDGGPILVSASD